MGFFNSLGRLRSLLVKNTNNGENTMNAFEDNCNGAASRGTPKSYEFIRLKQPTIKQAVTVNTAKLYPTIAKDQITIENKSGIQSISILNSLGQVITTNKYNTTNHLQVSINNYPAGIYLVKITDAKAAISMLKFVKN